MKKLLIIGILGLFVMVSESCKKPQIPIKKDGKENKDNSGGKEEDKPSAYVGTWDYTKIILSNGTLGFMGQNLGTFDGVGTKIVGEVVITEEPNVYTTEVEFTATVETTIGGQTQTQDIPVEKKTSSGTWTESNGNISLKDDNGNTVSIISSNSSKIEFEGNFSENIILGQGFEIDANSDVTFTIEK
jgi:hypothetical protein